MAGSGGGRSRRTRAAPTKRPNNEGAVRSLPVTEWPEADLEGWSRACLPASRLKVGGAASHLAPITQDDLARRYGYFLDFLKRTGLLKQHAKAGAQVTPENVEAYINELQARIGSVTVHGSIFKLRRTVELIAPDARLDWLHEIEKDLALVTQPASKFDRLVLTEVLVEAGLNLVAEADLSTRTELHRARSARNGLMIALLALCPIRLKNFAALEIDRHFREIKGSWWIVLSSRETKSRRSDERQVPGLLNPAIGAYINLHRPILARSKPPATALWLSSNDGAPMTYNAVERVLSETTRSAIGVNVSPHLFRAAAASTAAVHGVGSHPHLASALLHHTHPSVTEEHYNRATGMSAAQTYAEITKTYRRLD